MLRELNIPSNQKYKKRKIQSNKIIKNNSSTNNNIIKIGLESSLSPSHNSTLGDTPNYSKIDNNDKQEIIGQSVDPGEVLAKGDNITLYIPRDMKKYPDFVKEKWTIDAVKSFADKYELILTIKEEETNSYKPGTIIGQNRPAKTEIVRGASLIITVAKEVTVLEEEVDIPDDGGEGGSGDSGGSGDTGNTGN